MVSTIGFVLYGSGVISAFYAIYLNRVQGEASMGARYLILAIVLLLAGSFL